MLESFDELIKRNLILFIGEFCKLLHGAISFITFQDYSIEQLRHQEEVIDFAAKDVLEAGLIGDLELNAFNCCCNIL